MLEETKKLIETTFNGTKSEKWRVKKVGALLSRTEIRSGHSLNPNPNILDRIWASPDGQMLLKHNLIRDEVNMSLGEITNHHFVSEEEGLRLLRMKAFW